MTDETGAGDELAAARAHADDLRRQLDATRADNTARLVRAELKAEAVRAGMVDLDGLKLLDLARVHLNADGDVDGAQDLIANFRRAKPWLFGAVPTSSASAAQPPRAEPPRQKTAMQMTASEYRAARAELLRRRF